MMGEGEEENGEKKVCSTGRDSVTRGSGKRERNDWKKKPKSGNSTGIQDRIDVLRVHGLARIGV